MSAFEAFHGWKPIEPSIANFPKDLQNSSDLRFIDFDLAQRVLKQRISLNEIFHKRESIKQNLQKSEENPLEIGTRVLYKGISPTGSKISNDWLGQFVIIKRLDNDSYLVSPLDDSRKRYIVYRGLLKPLGGNKVEINKELKSESKHSYHLRKKSPVDYRKHF